MATLTLSRPAYWRYACDPTELRWRVARIQRTRRYRDRAAHCGAYAEPPVIMSVAARDAHDWQLGGNRGDYPLVYVARG